MHDGRLETECGDDSCGVICLADARLDQQGSTRCNPLGRLRGDAAVQGKSIRPTIESHPGLMVPRLRRHRADRGGRHVRRVGDDHIGVATNRLRQRRIEITLVHVAADGCQVATRTSRCSSVDVGGMHLDVGDAVCERETDCTRSATDIDHHVRITFDGLRNEQGRPAAGDEHTRFDENAEATELGPPEKLLEWRTGDALRYGLLEVFTGEGIEKKTGFDLGVHAACSAQPLGDARGGAGLFWHFCLSRRRQLRLTA